MAKKRKAPKTFEQPQTAKSAKFNIEERFDDSEDEFYAGREKILLEEGADSKRRRRIIEEEKHLQPSDEEILGYEDEDDVDSEDEGESDDYNDDNGIKEPPNGKGQRSKRQNNNEEDDDLSEDEHWGTNRADYYDADVIETEADALEEEKEARRLHQKQMKGMTEADFGFDENEWAGDQQDTKKQISFVEKLPEARIPTTATEEQKLQILRSRYPELQPLAADFLRLQNMKKELDTQASETLQKIANGQELGAGIPVTVKRNTLTAYLAAISTYFVILSSRVATAKDAQIISAIPPVELHEHAVIQTLAKARELWDRVANEETASLRPATGHQLEKTSNEGIAQVNGNHVVSAKKGLAKKEKSQLKDKKETQRDDSSDIFLDDIDTGARIEPLSSKKKLKKSKGNGKAKPLDLNTLMNAAATEDVSSDSDYGDEQPLTEEQYAEKDRKRKSLRFYTSQIASKANKRGHASRVAGGDDDLPYKERNRDRQERLIKAAEAKGRAAADTFDDVDGEDDYGDGQRNKDENDEYYDTLLNATNRKKSEKKAKAEAYAAAAKEGAEVYEEETVGPDGKRAITYAIAKNKGLMPRRKKEVRNPRVKKRMKFDEKMKKLGSMRQVYKGGEGRGGYAGELTGIKANVVKSVKL